MGNMKEHELVRQTAEVDELASKEVESYIERVEKSTEVTASDSNSQNHVTNTGDTNVMAGSSSQSNKPAITTKKPIVLPINQSDLQDGLKIKTNSGLKWLAEWCLMMIKKYPGRVFYNPSNTYD